VSVSTARIWLEEVEESAYEIDESGELTFGRQPRQSLDPAPRPVRMVVDPDNLQLHRDLGRVSFRDGGWWLANTGSRVVLKLRKPDRDEDMIVEPELGTDLPNGVSTLGFVAGRAHYAICIEISDLPRSAEDAADLTPPSGVTTVKPGDRVVLTVAQRRVLVLMCEPCLRATGGQVWSVPGNQELADRLGIKEGTIERHVGDLYERFSADNVPGLLRVSGQPVSERRRKLVEFAVRAGHVTRFDLADT